MTAKLIYVADLDQDVDDCIAAEYLHAKNILSGIVYDPYPSNPEGRQRKVV